MFCYRVSKLNKGYQVLKIEKVKKEKRKTNTNHNTRNSIVNEHINQFLWNIMGRTTLDGLRNGTKGEGDTRWK